MVGQAEACGLLIKEGSNYEYQIDLKKDIHNSAFNIFGLEILVEPRDATPTLENEHRVHWSVREKMQLNESYKPLALMKHINDPATLSPYVVEE